MQKKIFSIFKEFKISHLLCLLLGIAILVAPVSSAFSAEPKAKVMTRNVYLGANIFRVVYAPPQQIPYAVADVYRIMLSTNFWERAEALADEISLFEPDVVGLQEVSTYYIQTPGDFIFGNPVQANTLVIDFYSVLDAALKARGMEYTAYTVTNADIEMPMVDPNAGPPYYLSDARMVDHDVILVRKDHVASNEQKGTYLSQREVILGDTEISFSRGYIAVDVNIKGDDFRFVNTHLETGGVWQADQMEELLTILEGETKPIIMVGDFNSSPPEDVPAESYVRPYMQAVNAGYLDTWLLQDRYDEGYTAGFGELVNDPNAELGSRIDLIFLDPKDLEIDKVKAAVVGNKVEDMTPSGLWPSDHAGVVAKIKFSLPY
jgi:endonuclease/exonuclease/phosphatase family metal-dependent hydrolase